MSQEISDELLGAYIDEELSPEEKAHLVERIATDASVRARACELWQLKQLMRSAYWPVHDTGRAATRHGAKNASKKDSSSLLRRLPMAIAASLLMAAGTLSGWLAHERQEIDGLSVQQMNAIRANGSRVVLHLVSDEPERIEAALRMADKLASAQDTSGQPIHVEFIANGSGVHLLRTGGSPFAERLIAHSNAHPNLQILACRQTVDRLRERGVAVELLSVVQEAASAESLLAARLSQGWRYVQA